MLSRFTLVTVAAIPLLVSACSTMATSLGPPPLDSPSESSSSVAALKRLAERRAKTKTSSSYRLGPGDMIEVTVFDRAEMTRRLRISEDGTVIVPLIGTVKAGGKTEEELSREIVTRLQDSYLQSPQVDVFVAEYRSKRVAVTGAVKTPGLYPMRREGYTILDMLSEAGGLSYEAGAFIEFIPAESVGAAKAFQRADRNVNAGEAPKGISIDLAELTQGSNRTLLELPVVPGDVIYVPQAGGISVEGWVEKPANYPLTRGMTVLSSIGAAGGELFPAALSRVEVLRGGANDRLRQRRVIDLTAVREARAADLTLRGGDVVRVPANPVLVPPYFLYSAVRDLFRIGASALIF